MRHYGSFSVPKWQTHRVSHICAVSNVVSRCRWGRRTTDFCRCLPERVQQAVTLFLKIFYDGAEVNRLIRETPILRDFGLIHHFESVALKQFETAPAVECHHLRVDLFDTVVVEMAQVDFEQLASNLDRLGCRKKVDVEMPDGPGRRGHLTPCFRDKPMNILPGFRSVAEVATDNLPAVNEIL